MLYKKKYILIIVCNIVSSLFAYKMDDLIKLNIYKTCPNCDLTNAPLYGLNIRYADLRKSNLSNANVISTVLTGADMRQTKNYKTRYNSSVLVNADFSNSDLTKAELKNVRAQDANFINCILDQTNIIWSILIGAFFMHSKMNGMNLERADLSNANFAYATGKFVYDYYTTFCKTLMPDIKVFTNSNDARCYA